MVHAWSWHRLKTMPTGISEVALSGGVWQNRRLTAFVSKMLKRDGFVPLLHRLLPPNDECVSVGQVAVAAALRRREKKGE
jgi:hydrogenase maturation protein HypF